MLHIQCYVQTGGKQWGSKGHFDFGFRQRICSHERSLAHKNVLRFKPRTETSHIHLREIPPDLTEPQVYIQWTGYMQQQVWSTRHGCRGGERVSERGGPSESHVHDPGKASGMLPVIEADEAISYCPVPPPPQQSGFHQVLEPVGYCIAAWNRFEIDSSFQLDYPYLDSISSTRPYQFLQSIATMTEFMVKWDTRCRLDKSRVFYWCRKFSTNWRIRLAFFRWVVLSRVNLFNHKEESLIATGEGGRGLSKKVNWLPHTVMVCTNVSLR